MEQLVPQIETLNTESPSPKSHVSRNQTLLHLESPKFLHDFDGQAWSLRTVAAREAGKNGEFVRIRCPFVWGSHVTSSGSGDKESMNLPCPLSSSASFGGTPQP